MTISALQPIKSALLIHIKFSPVRRNSLFGQARQHFGVTELNRTSNTGTK
jgi:hypothetical protein